MALSLLSVFFTSMILLLPFMDGSVEAARQFKVGDHLGWHQPSGPNNSAFYNQWASRNRFQVGDSLVFEYQNDSVLTVEKWEYFHCDTNNPIDTLENGNSTVILDSPGAFYFISGIADHCHNGQKLIVDVMSPHSIPHSPPSISLPPQGFSASPPSHSHASSATMLLASLFMALSTIFVIVLLLAP
ncbi:hypothetical protein RJT34_17130 [Clitoria ternatea]|uniref:Phytocyanin domain-containing protein n=1 Tax=Clitoria ternatea TaxID=43366 RepID=A0AAN9PCY7_CLITE